MGTEWVIPILGLPFLGCLIVLVVLSTRHWRVVPDPNHTLGLGRGRIAAGYVGVMLASLGVALWLMWSQLQYGLDSGNYPRESASSYAIELLLFYFISFGALMLFCLTIIGLPLFAMLRRMRLLSGLGLGLLASLVSALLFWRGGSLAEVIPVCFLLAAAFAGAARLPLVRSPQMPVNTSLEQP